MAKIGDYEAGGDTFTDIKLLELESDPMMLYGDGITTMQFYNGDGHKAAEFLKKRLLEVGELNPWIGSTCRRAGSSRPCHAPRCGAR